MQVDKDAQGQITQKDLFGVVVRGVTSRFFFWLPDHSSRWLISTRLFVAASVCATY
jgi:hypothetical protein